MFKEKSVYYWVETWRGKYWAPWTGPVYTLRLAREEAKKSTVKFKGRFRVIRVTETKTEEVV